MTADVTPATDRHQYTESLTDWAALHGEEVEVGKVDPFLESCERHGPWRWSHGGTDRCPTCTAITDAENDAARHSWWANHDDHATRHADEHDH